VSDNNYPSGQIDKVNQTTKDRSPHWQKLGLLTIAALLAGYVLNYLEAAPTWSQLIDRLVVSVGFFILLFGLLWREMTRIRKEKFANIQEDLHGIQHVIRDQLTILELMEGRSEDEVRLHAHIVEQNVQECLNRFASVFTLLTGTKCRATLKMIEPGKTTDKPVVYTFMRDIDSERFFKDDDDERRAKGADLLEDNTDFSSVFGTKGERWFFCNDLTAQTNYLNSRDKNLTKRDLAGLRAFMNLWKPTDWNLPYSSTIVWPIRHKGNVPLGAGFSFLGFLTIDSRHRGVFDIKFDTHLGASVADSFHHMLVRLIEVGTRDGTND